MKKRLIPQKYELCNRFNEKELAEMSLHLATKKELRYIRNVKSFRLRKKYADRLLRRTESYLQFVKNEAKKRGSCDFLYDNNVFIIFKKNRFVGFRVGDVGQNNSSEISA